MSEPSVSNESVEERRQEPLPPWAAVGQVFYGHRDWRVAEVVGQWIKVVEAKSRSGTPEEGWIYLPTGVVYGSATLQRRSSHGLPTVGR